VNSLDAGPRRVPNTVAYFLDYCRGYLQTVRSFSAHDAQLLVMDPTLGPPMDEAKRLWLSGIGFATDPDPILLSKGYGSPIMTPIDRVLDDFASKFAVRKSEIQNYLTSIGHPFAATYADQRNPATAPGTLLKNIVLIGVGVYCVLRGEWVLVTLALLCLIPSHPSSWLSRTFSPAHGLIWAIVLALSLIVSEDYVPGAILAALILYNIVGWAWLQHRFGKR
jgi:hypothetical protein